MFQTRFHAFRPRHPLARILVGVLGLVIAAMLVALGLFALIALAIGGAIFMLVRALRASSKPAAATPSAPPPGVIEGEFTVVPGAPSQDVPAATPR